MQIGFVVSLAVITTRAVSACSSVLICVYLRFTCPVLVTTLAAAVRYQQNKGKTQTHS
jgi:hypothetical protein